MDAIWQTTFSSAFSWMKMFEFLLKFHWSFIPKGRINNIPALVQIMAWRWPGDKPLSEPMMVSLPTHICVTRPQWVKAMSYPLAWWDSCILNLDKTSIFGDFNHWTLVMLRLNISRAINNPLCAVLNKRVSQMRAPLATRCEPPGKQNRPPKVLYVFEHKTW